MTTAVTDFANLLKSKPKTKRESFHKNLQIGIVILGIVAISISTLVNFYTLKHIKK